MSDHVEWFKAKSLSAEVAAQGEDVGIFAVDHDAALLLGDLSSSVAAIEGSEDELLSLLSRAAVAVREHFGSIVADGTDG